VTEWRTTGTSIPYTIDAVVAFWGVCNDDIPMLTLGVLLVATRQTMAFNWLEAIQCGLQQGHSVEALFRAILEAMILTADHC